MTLPLLITELRKQAGLSKPDLKERLGVEMPTIHSWETTEEYHRAPSPRYLQMLLDLADATDEQRTEAWRLLAEADKAHAEKRARRNAEGAA